MTNLHRHSLWLSSSLLLATALTGCGVDNSRARFSTETALLEVGSHLDVLLTDVDDLSRLQVRGANDSIGASLLTTEGIAGDHQMVRVRALTVGETTLELLDEDTVLDTITVQAGTVARFDVAAPDVRQGERFNGDDEFTLVVGEPTILILVARDALERPFDSFVPRSIAEHAGFEPFADLYGSYVFEAVAPGTHVLTVEADMGANVELEVTAVLSTDVSALRVNVSEENRDVCVSVSGLTAGALPVLGISPDFLVDGEPPQPAGILQEPTGSTLSLLGVLCFDDAPAPGTEVTGTWNELSATHTF